MSEPKRDRHGRYLIPIDGVEVAHTRCTSIAGTLDDRFFIERWAQRNLAKGLGLRPDLYALAQATPLTEKSTLNRVCKEAIDAAAGGARANLGTALHAFTEQVDAGQDVEIPEPWDRDIAAYRECLEAYGIDIHPGWIEVIAVCDELAEPIAGTIDRIVTYQDRLFIADLKTGDNLHFQWRKIAAQLAIYSRSSTLYDPDTEKHHPMPEVDQDHGIVFHLPAGEASCTPYLVDLNEGWRAARMAVAVREWRKNETLHTELAA